MDVLLQPPEQTRSRRGRAEVVNELLWVAAKRTFTSPGPWALSCQSVRRTFKTHGHRPDPDGTGHTQRGSRGGYETGERTPPTTHHTQHDADG